MTGMYQILRIDDSIVRKMDLKEGVNTIGNNLNPPVWNFHLNLSIAIKN